MAEPRTERRKHPRVPAGELPLHLGADRTKPLRIRDLSRSGVAFYAEDPIPVMTRVRFSMEFPREGADPLLASGEGVVVRCERVSTALAHYEVAVFFSHLQPEAVDLLRHWVNRRLAQVREA